MYEKILVPLDGSELAEVALPYAEELGGKLGARIILLNIAESARHQQDRWHRFYMEKMAEATAREAKRHSRKRPGAEIATGYEIIVGTPAESIVDYASKEKVDLIIMATHGWSGVDRWEMGSIADRVVRASRQPVLLVRAKDARPDVREKGAIRRALVPLDGSAESETVTPYIKELASKLKSRVVLCQVVEQGYKVSNTGEGAVQIPYTPEEMRSIVDSSRRYLEKIGDSLKEAGIAVKVEVRIGNIADEIIRFADEIKTDLVAMSTHGRSGIRRWAFGSVATKILQAGNKPLMLIRA